MTLARLFPLDHALEGGFSAATPGRRARGADARLYDARHPA
jgi:hypothetical protein